MDDDQLKTVVTPTIELLIDIIGEYSVDLTPSHTYLRVMEISHHSPIIHYLNYVDPIEITGSRFLQEILKHHAECPHRRGDSDDTQES